MTIFGLFAQLISGLASPAIFAPSFVIGWFVRRWWQVLIGAVLVAVVSDAEVMLIEMPDAKPDWSTEPLAFIAPLCWCGCCGCPSARVGRNRCHQRLRENRAQNAAATARRR